MSCDAELQELMVQVDRVVEERRAEWQDKIKITESKLQSTLQENYSMKSIIDDRNIEISNLKAKLKGRDSEAAMPDYDQEVLKLRFEVTQIKKSYEKYHHKYIKKAKEIEKEKEDLFLEKNELLKEVNYLKCQEKQRNQENNKHRMEVEEIEMKRNEAISDRTILSEQLNSLKKNFAQQLETFSRSEQIYNSNLMDLESQLQESKRCLQKEIEYNRNKLCDLMQLNKKASEEKQQFINDNESAKRMIIRLEQELGKIMSENKMKNKTIYKLEQVIKISENAINEKNEVLKVLRVNSSTKDSSPQISKLENELLEVKTGLKLSMKNEKSLQYEIISLSNKFKEAQELIENEENNKKKSEINMKEIIKLEEEKNYFKKQIEKLEGIIECKAVEMNNSKNHIECLLLENESYKQRINQESLLPRKSGDSISAPKEHITISDYDTNQNHNQTNTKVIDKERNELLQFCQDKDMVIQRLQMENRILQEFITKLNFGLSDECPYAPSQSYFNGYETVSDVFHPLKETFIDYNYDSSTDFNRSTHYTDKKSSESPTIKNRSQSYQNEDNILYRSSEEFISLLSHNGDGNANPQLRDSYLTLYPTLTAAKYFTDEREKSKQFEEVIDKHVAQLKLENCRKCSTQNL